MVGAENAAAELAKARMVAAASFIVVVLCSLIISILEGDALNDFNGFRSCVDHGIVQIFY